MSATTLAEKITRASKSNLALAFVSLPKERRHDITVFYAFCRVVDDIGDDPGVPLEEKRRELALWREAVSSAQENEPEFAGEVRAVIQKYEINPSLLREIIAGVEMDLARTRYETWEELERYCWRVASAVGLASIEIFGYRDPACREYAVALGLALQLTNIIRDVGADVENGGRIYLPREEMARFGVTPDDLAAKRHTPEFTALMRFEADRARELFANAKRLLPSIDERSMVAAEIMRKVYKRLLGQMIRDGFRVLGKRYALNPLEKAFTVAGTLVGRHFARR